jgi:hypothetical protein
VCRFQQGYVQKIRSATGDDDTEPCDTGTDEASSHQAEQDAEDNVSGEMTGARMQGQRGDRSPPFAIANQLAVDPADDKPVAIKKRFPREPGNQANNGDVSCNARNTALIDRFYAGATRLRFAVLLIVLPQLVFRFFGQLLRDDKNRPLPDRNDLV